jgi:hypothetical protein
MLPLLGHKIGIMDELLKLWILIFLLIFEITLVFENIFFYFAPKNTCLFYNLRHLTVVLVSAFPIQHYRQCYNR